MNGIKYFDKVLAKELGVKIKELTIDMINDYIDKKEKEATSCASEMQAGSRANLGILRLQKCSFMYPTCFNSQKTKAFLIVLKNSNTLCGFSPEFLTFLPYKEELEIRQYILNWGG